MNIRKTTLAASSAAKHQQVSTQKTLSRDELAEGVKVAMSRDKLLPSHIKYSGRTILEELTLLDGQTVAEMKANLSAANAKAQKRASRGKVIATIGEGTIIASLLFAESHWPLAISLAGLGIATATAGYVTAGLGESAFRISNGRLSEVEAWECYLQNKSAAPEQPTMHTPIAKDEFLSAVKLHGASPHPERMLLRHFARKGLEAFEGQTGDTEAVKSVLRQTGEKAREEERLSRLQSVIGFGLATGSLIGGASGLLNPGFALGLGSSGLAIGLTGNASRKNFRAEKFKAFGGVYAIEDWERYLSGAGPLKKPLGGN